MPIQSIFFEEFLQDIEIHLTSIEGLLKLSNSQINAVTAAHEWSVGKQIEHLRLSSEGTLAQLKNLNKSLPLSNFDNEVSLSFA